MALKEYQKKRNFSKTPEPSGERPESICKQVQKEITVPKQGHPYFMVHDHRSRNHHFDLRLEQDGVLKSWAIPKLIDLKNPYSRRLAVQTEDHPLEYGYWEGTIPEGEYGAGVSKIWDSGTWKSVDEKKNKIIFELKGKRLKGTFVLIHFRPKEKNWLFFKKKDP